MANVAPPNAGLSGNSNYFLYSQCNPITDLSVIIDITETMLAPTGMGFQLNCWSALGSNSVWQQYVVAFDTSKGPNPDLFCQIDNWPAPGFDGTSGGDLINKIVPLVTLPGTNPALPAGYQIRIDLANKSGGAIDGVTFTIADNQGNVFTSGLISLTSLHVDGNPSEPITQAALAPINAIQLNVVGKTNGEATYLPTGAGTITYSASSPLTALGAQPACTTSQGIDTEEQANAGYDELAEGAATQIRQTFSASIRPSYSAGGAFAVSRQFGTDRTNLYVTSRTGQIDIFRVEGDGAWRLTTGLGVPGMARPYAKIVASERFGAPDQTDIFLVDQAGFINVASAVGGGAWTNPKRVSGGAKNNAHQGGDLALSRQIGTNRTDIFFVNSKETLSLVWVEGVSGASPAPVNLSGPNFAPKGAPLAASQRFGTPDRTDVFVVNNTGQLTAFTVHGGGAWGPAVKIGKPGHYAIKSHISASQQFGIANQTDLFIVNQNGQLNVYWAHGSGAWSPDPVLVGPAALAAPGAPITATRHFGMSNRTDVFLVNTSGRLNMFWIEAAGVWNGPSKLGPDGVGASGTRVVASQHYGEDDQTDVFLLNTGGTNAPGWPTLFWTRRAGPWGGPVALVTEA